MSTPQPPEGGQQQPRPWEQQPAQAGQDLPAGQGANGQPQQQVPEGPCCPGCEGGPGEPFTVHYFAVHRDDGYLDLDMSLIRVPDSDLATARIMKKMNTEAGRPALYGLQSGRWLQWDGSVYAPQKATYADRLAEWVATVYARLLRDVEKAIKEESARKAVAGSPEEMEKKGGEERARLKALWGRHRKFCDHIWSERGQVALAKQLGRTCSIDESLLDAGTGEIIVDSGRISYGQILASYKPAQGGRPAVLPAVQPLEHDQEQLVTRRMGRGVDYDPSAECPAFDQFLATSVADPHQQWWLCWRAANALFGRMPRKGFVNPIGERDSGKTTFETLMHALGGSYVITVPVTTFMAKHTGDSGFLAAELRGARMVCAAEPKPGGRYDDGYMKDITGRGPQRTAGKWEKPVQWVPQCTPFIASNAPIRFATSDEGMMERQEAIRFARGYGQLDPNLPDRMKTELPGILNRLLETVLWEAEHGLPQLPDSMVAERERLADETEDALRFVSQQLEEGLLAGAPRNLPVSSYAQVDPLFRAYQDWCDDQEGVREAQRLGRKDFRAVVGRRYPAQRSNGYRFTGLVVPGTVRMGQ